MNNASALIYTREKHIGFPGGWFKVQPEDFSDETVKLVMQYAMSAMEDVKPLRSNHKQVHVVIAENGYVVLGIASYLRDLFSDGWEGTDEKNRPIYGFFGYVWKQNDFNTVCKFPNLSEFSNLVAEYIRPNWELSKNAHWATHQELVPYRYMPCEEYNVSAVAYAPAKIESVENVDRLIEWAIQKAASGQTVSVCTNVTIYDVKDYKTPFQHVSQAASSKKNFSTGSDGSNGGSTGSGTSSRTSNTVGKQSSDGVGSTSNTNDLYGNGGAGIPDGTSTQTKKVSKLVPVALIALGVVLLILSIALIPTAWMTGMLWKAMLIASVACIAAGIIRLAKAQKQYTNESVADPTSIPSKNHPSSPDNITPFKAGEKTVSQPSGSAAKSNQKTTRAKKPEEETTEDLFKF